ncbi:MAG: IS66 family insertion sequence element accessory protein TnpA [Phocaeicola sp.]
MRHRMNKDEFLSILDRQRQSGLTIKDFCENEVYPASCFYYWKSKYGFSDKAPSSKPLDGFAPVRFSSPRACSESNLQDVPSDESITIEFPTGMKIHFRGRSQSATALQVITQISCAHVLPK